MGKWKFTAEVTSRTGRPGTGTGVAEGTREQAEAAARRQIAAEGRWPHRVHLEEQDD